MLDGVDWLVENVVLLLATPLFRLQRLGEQLVRRTQSAPFAELELASTLDC